MPELQLVVDINLLSVTTYHGMGMTVYKWPIVSHGLFISKSVIIISNRKYGWGPYPSRADSCFGILKNPAPRFILQHRQLWIRAHTARRKVGVSIHVLNSVGRQTEMFSLDACTLNTTRWQELPTEPSIHIHFGPRRLSPMGT